MVSPIQEAFKRAGELRYENSYSDLKLFIYTTIEDNITRVITGAKR
jgi:hypothetical protein